MMNQDMHNWIATALSIATIKIVFQKHSFRETIIFVIDLLVPIILLGIWLYRIY